MKTLKVGRWIKTPEGSQFCKNQSNQKLMFINWCHDLTDVTDLNDLTDGIVSASAPVSYLVLYLSQTL